MNETRKIPVFLVYCHDDNECLGVFIHEHDALKKACEISIQKFNSSKEFEYKVLIDLQKLFNQNLFFECWDHLSDHYKQICPEIIETELIE